MEAVELLGTLGKVAGIGGIALAVAVLVFRDVIAKNIFRKLTREQSYRLLRLIVILAFLLGVGGIAGWVFFAHPQIKWPSRFEELRTAEFLVSDVDDELLISVNDRPLQGLKFGQSYEPIPFTHLLRRGSNKLSFIVLNGAYGGCGAKVVVNLNGVRNKDYSWAWFKDIDKACADCNCFTFNKTLHFP